MLSRDFLNSKLKLENKTIVPIGMVVGDFYEPKEPKKSKLDFRFVMHCNAIKLNAFTALKFIGENMVKEKKRQVCFRMEESMVQEMEQIRDKTGVPISRQIELRMKGFTITSIPQKGIWENVLQWYINSEKDDKLAENIEAATKRMKELKLH